MGTWLADAHHHLLRRSELSSGQIDRGERLALLLVAVHVCLALDEAAPPVEAVGGLS